MCANPIRTRLDQLVVERGLASSRERAQAMILAGQVLVNDQKVEKCGTAVPRDARLRVLGVPPRYVSRAGVKLEGALDHFGVDPTGRTCLDIGSSTGGFTDCLLQRGAAKVFAVDVGTNQLDWKLRGDPRVVSLERTNARSLEFGALGSRASLVTMDVSFISCTLILPAIPPLVEPGAHALILVKPQFELEREQVGKGGIVRDAGLRQEAVRRVTAKLRGLGFCDPVSVESVLPGAEGNREYFIHALWPQTV